MTIKHLVISGGGPVMFRAMGALQKLEEEKFWNRNDIQNIFGTSAGAFVAVIICLNYDWETILKYFIERPWHEAFPITPTSLFDAYGKKGIYDKSIMKTIFKPLFDDKDISLTVTMKEFFEKTNICLHLYTFELHQFETVDMSYLTHPNFQLLDVVYMSSALPIICAPLCIENKCFMDGGIKSNYPLDKCFEHVPNTNSDEILAFRNVYNEEEKTFDESKQINEDSTIMDYLHLFLRKLMKTINTESKQKSVKYEVKYQAQRITIEYLQEALSSQNMRRGLLHTGREAAENMINSIQCSKIDQETTQ